MKIKDLICIGYTAIFMAATGLFITSCSDDPGDGLFPEFCEEAGVWNYDKGICMECGKFIYRIGETGPGGGMIFYISVAGFNVASPAAVAHYLEAALSDMPQTIPWAHADNPDIRNTNMNFPLFFIKASLMPF